MSGEGGEGGGAQTREGGVTEGGPTLPDGAQRPDVVLGTNPSKLAVALGSAGSFVVLAKAGISSGPASAITGDLGVSPAAATYITGFDLTADATNVFATSAQVTGRIFASDHASPTPASLTAAVSDMETAFVDAAGRAPDVTELGAGVLGGRTLTKGVYQWSTGLLIPTDVTLTGSATDVWIFQIAQNLTVANGTRVLLAGGALAKNVFWQVSGAVDLGTTSHLDGVVLSQTAIALHTGASIEGRLLAQTAVTLEAASVVQPAP
ncbi:MAG TPA: ice-binding family protein [Polyangiaceae bacterium]|nr:ice-binding family protein [Polyangiaceae bacterium]